MIKLDMRTLEKPKVIVVRPKRFKSCKVTAERVEDEQSKTQGR